MIDTKRIHKYMDDYARLWKGTDVSRTPIGVRFSDLKELLNVYERVQALRAELGITGAARASSPRKGRRPRAAKPTSRPRRR